MIYLDHAATTRPDEAVIAAMTDAMRAAAANPSALYAAAGAARGIMRRARRAVAALTGADPDGVLFTSGGTEALNWATRQVAGRHIVLSAVEHHAVLRAAALWSCDVTLVPPDANGRITAEAVECAMRPDTAMIAVQFANNETGVIHDVGAIGALAGSRRVPFLCDAVQAVGRVPVDMAKNHIDLLALSAHKFYGPRGVGALVTRPGMTLRPLIAGGGQENGLRGGTENVPGIAGLAAAAALAEKRMPDEAPRQTALIERFTEKLRAGIPGCRTLGENTHRLPGVAAFLIPELDATQAIARLDLRGVMVSGGAACSARSGEISHVYRAMGLSEAEARCVIRVSTGVENTAEDMDRAALEISEITG